MKTSRPALIVLGFLFALLSSCQTKSPNVILIMADDMGAECLTAYGNTEYQTPRLDRMAEEGLVVSHCIAQPLCTPSRVKLMTGLSNRRNYTHFGHLDTRWLNMGTVMKEAGYRTCVSGKWQLNGLSYPGQFPDWNDPTRPHQMGFDEYCLWQLTHRRSEGERYSDPLIEQNGKLLETSKDDYGPDIFADYILDFIDRNGDEPFFVYYPMVLVHDPFVPTPDSREWEDAGSRYEADTSYFADMMTYTDRVVGRILDKLEEKGIDENTLVLFTADNGTHPSVYSQTRERLVRGAKGNTITDGVRVPLLIRWPEKIRKSTEFKGLVEFSDFFATLADLVGRRVETDGKSFLPLLEGKKFPGRESARVYYDPRWGNFANQYRNSFVQTPDYKLYQDGSFFRLEADILEEQPVPEVQMTESERNIRNHLKSELFPVPDAPPNLVLIMTDDQGYGDLSIHGHPILETPHLDALGKQGTRLDNFHVSPVCAPTRAGLLTGRRPMSTGAYWVTRGGEIMDDEEYTLAELLKENGYETACIGKWHNGSRYPYRAVDQGFDRFFGFAAGHWNRYFDPELEYNGRRVSTKGYIADIFTDSAISYIRDHRDERFFCYLAYNTPHSPFQVPDSYFDRYIDRVEEEDPALQIMNASVYGMVKNIDDNVGRIMKTLADLGLEENTLVVFLTDNGPNTARYNGEMKGRKGWVNDGGVRVPCFLRWKDHIPPGKVVRSLSAHIDLMPTLAGMMGLSFDPPNEIHGIDLTPWIFGVERERRGVLYTHVNHGQEIRTLPGAVRTSDWRLTLQGDGSRELTRMSDFREDENLETSFPRLADSLEALYRDWFEPFMSHRIPPVEVGSSDPVKLLAHEGRLLGNARYFWSASGWSNDWVTSMDINGSGIAWDLEVTEPGNYRVEAHYTSPEPSQTLLIRMDGLEREITVPRYSPVKDKNYSRIDRSAEAIGQTWNTIPLGSFELDRGPAILEIFGSGPAMELLELVVHSTQKQ